MPDATFFPAASDPNCTLDCDEPEKATKENSNYRTVAWTGRYLQVALMSIPPGSSIGLEAHPETDQFVRLDAGKGHVTMGPAEDDLSFQLDVEDGWSVQVPAGVARHHQHWRRGHASVRGVRARPPHAGHRPEDL
jgi:mannose-6-phosphate isomerase-like protein (cupin superfamily)